jgi:hypothetical protein
VFRQWAAGSAAIARRVGVRTHLDDTTADGGNVASKNPPGRAAWEAVVGFAGFVFIGVLIFRSRRAGSSPLRLGAGGRPLPLQSSPLAY